MLSQFAKVDMNFSDSGYLIMSIVNAVYQKEI